MIVSVLSNGSFGTALAEVLCQNGHDVTLWGRSEQYVQQMQKTRVNERYMPDFKLHPKLKLSSDMAQAIAGAQFIILATPVQFVRQTLEKLARVKQGNPILVNVSKGIEVQSLQTVSQICRQFFGPEQRYVVLAGPSHAEEIVQKLPTALVAASENLDDAALVQEIFMNEYIRVYTSGDVIGVEVGGALKNIFAIAAGIIDGMGLGDNTKAALMTRGIVEKARLGTALGGHAETFSGLSGIGDLIVTCTSRHSRNRFVGEQLGKGMSMEEIVKAMGHSVAEGVKTTESAWKLARQLGVETPIIDEAYAVLYQHADPRKALLRLMTRAAKEEQQ